MGSVGSVESVVSVPPLLRGVRGDLQLGFSWEISDRCGKARSHNQYSKLS
ncbi:MULTISPECIES: hypothetical protein [unclassified Moorena]|nr:MULTISPECIES: hypothetical protein [unclassified Moorena]NEQ14716.1 hypothetical protein [Moorena sp. SIO3E2]NER87969.1 hypothetical protein [Moorena sp. SIO3A2]NES41320.1 hypothetical protein [Moorena sp. SIO2C4]NET63360.1 hypothetical protein [Moorena sp. SIO1G6]